MRPETRYEELKRYVDFSERDEQILLRLRDHASSQFPRIAQEFYDRIREHEDAHAVFRDEAQIVRLQHSLVRWMDRLLGGRYDEAYYAETSKIGHVHVRVGLPQRYMFTAMALIRVALTRIADDKLGEDARPGREALERLLDIELAVMLEAYREAYTARIQQVERLETQAVSRRLLRAEHRYVNAVELARVIVVGLDAHGKICLVNREAERVTGFGRDELLGAAFIERFVAGDVRAAEAPMFERAMKSAQAQPEPIESSLETRAGKLRDVRWQLAAAPSETEDETVFFAIGEDITDARALAERTRQNEKLAAVGTLAAGLAHEIRNPLNGAQLHLAFLERALRKRKDADADMQEAIAVVGDEIKRLATLVTEFLDFARPKPLVKKPLSVRALCEKTLQFASQRAAEAQVTTTLDLPSRELEIVADGAKLEQVLLNLLLNAIEALAPSGAGTVVLRARRLPRHVTIEVEDDGPGLPSPDAPIFDAFYSTKATGTGLGLAICHRIVTDHSGTISVDSRPGRTVFSVTLPIAATAQRSDAETAGLEYAEGVRVEQAEERA